MANINLSKAYATERFDGFSGMGGVKNGEGGRGAVDIKNFRVGADGSLTKRCGFAPLLNLPNGEVRALQVVSDELALAVVGNAVYKIDLYYRTYSLHTSLASIGSDACFFHYDNTLYLLDGNELYFYENDEFTPVEGYVPLYGKEWDVFKNGEVHQSANAFSKRLRISFKFGESSPSYLSLPFAIESIDGGFVNGVRVGDSDLSLGSIDTQVALSKTYESGDVLEIFFSPKSDSFPNGRQKATAFTRAQSFGLGTLGGDASSVAFFGGDDSSEICVTRSISHEDRTACESVYGDTLPLYLSLGDVTRINGGLSGITAACRCGSRLAVFSESSAYLLSESETGEVKLYPISETSGCCVKDGAITLESSPVTMSKQGVLLWTPSKLYDEEYVAERIDTGIDELIWADSVGALAYYRAKNELWFYHRGGRRVWIYNTELKCWYSFDGFYPDILFEIGEKMAFVSGYTVYAFSDEIFHDLASGAITPIEATLEAPPLFFGEVNRKKRLSRVMLMLSENEGATVTVMDDARGEVSVTMQSKAGSPIGHCETRLSCKRSRGYAFSISHNDADSGLHVYSAILTAVK